MASFQPPPTYSDVVIVDEITNKARFNPIWLKWFLELVQNLTPSGGGSGTVTSVAVSVPTGMNVAGSPVTTSGTLTISFSGSAAIAPAAITLAAGRLQEKQGADVATANNVTLGTDGNYFRLTGSTQVNLLDSTGWQGGSLLTLFLVAGTTVKHNQAASAAFKPIYLSGAVDFVAAAKARLTLRYDSTDSTWYEVGRTS